MVMPFKITVQYHKQDIDIDTGRYRSPFTARNPHVPLCSYDFLPLLLISWPFDATVTVSICIILQLKKFI